MGIVGGLDIHRRQITFDYLDTGTGEVSRGKIAPADRQQVRSWLEHFEGRERRGLRPGGRHRLALRRRGARAGGGPSPSGRAGRHRPRSAAVSSGPRPTAPTPGSCGSCWRWAGCPSPGSPRTTSSRSGPGSGCTRPWPTSAGPGCSASGPPCSTKASPPSPATCSIADGQAHLERADLSPSGRESVEVALGQIDRLDTELGRLRRAIWWPSATARWGAGPSRATTGSAVCCRWPSGRSSVTAGGSAPPPTPCATPVWTSPCGPRTRSGPGSPGPPGPGHPPLGALRGGHLGGQAQLPRP